MVLLFYGPAACLGSRKSTPARTEHITWFRRRDTLAPQMNEGSGRRLRRGAPANKPGPIRGQGLDPKVVAQEIGKQTFVFWLLQRLSGPPLGNQGCGFLGDQLCEESVAN